MPPPALIGRVVIAGVIVLVLVTMPLADVVPEPPFVTLVDWSFVVACTAFGFLGGLVRLNPQRQDQLAWVLLLSGAGAGLGTGLLLAETVNWVHDKPRFLLGCCFCAGVGGTKVLDIFGRRFLENLESATRGRGE